METDGRGLISPTRDVSVVEGELVASIRELAVAVWKLKAIARTVGLARNTVRRSAALRSARRRDTTGRSGGRAPPGRNRQRLSARSRSRASVRSSRARDPRVAGARPSSHPGGSLDRAPPDVPSGARLPPCIRACWLPGHRPSGRMFMAVLSNQSNRAFTPLGGLLARSWPGLHRLSA